MPAVPIRADLRVACRGPMVKKGLVGWSGETELRTQRVHVPLERRLHSVGVDLHIGGGLGYARAHRRVDGACHRCIDGAVDGLGDERDHILHVLRLCRRRRRDGVVDRAALRRQILHGLESQELRSRARSSLQDGLIGNFWGKI